MHANAATMFGTVDGSALTSALHETARASLECQQAKESGVRCSAAMKEASATPAEYNSVPIVKEEQNEDRECCNKFLVPAPVALKPRRAARSHRSSRSIVIPCCDLRFSQKSISECFRYGSSLGRLITELAANPDHVHLIGPLRIFKAGKHYVSLDNRRLACLFECSRFLGRALMVPCTLYSKRCILACFNELQVSKLQFYCKSAHKGAFVQVRCRHKRVRRVIRVLKKDALTPQGTHVFK